MYPRDCYHHHGGNISRGMFVPKRISSVFTICDNQQRHDQGVHPRLSDITGVE